ncbi:hypothetical protein WMY93_020014 [Mugilogobius chulae]|uniref:Uncharacterized protein n=1 Tax=Mugilogobius chulae TaxID=88201 RepID=A0AAW0NG32_9GOBI
MEASEVFSHLARCRHAHCGWNNGCECKQAEEEKRSRAGGRGGSAGRESSRTQCAEVLRGGRRGGGGGEPELLTHLGAAQGRGLLTSGLPCKQPRPKRGPDPETRVLSYGAENGSRNSLEPLHELTLV